MLRGDSKDLLESAIENDSPQKDTIFYLNKKRAIEAGISQDILNILSVPDSGLVHMITDPQSGVNIDVPYWGKGKQFGKWFRGSTVVNEDGSPRVVYHGTSENFNVFNMSKGRSTMDTDFYYTE